MSLCLSPVKWRFGVEVAIDNLKLGPSAKTDNQKMFVVHSWKSTIYKKRLK